MQTHESPARDALRLIVWYPLRWLLRTLPPSTAIAVLKLMGDLHYIAARGKRCQLINNLKRIDTQKIHTEKDALEIIRIYYQTHYLDQLFPLVFPKFKPENITDYVTVTGLSNLDNALAKKRGVLLVHGHFGPVHLPLVTLALMGYQMKQIGNPTNHGLSWIGRNVAFRLRMAYEQRIPAEIIRAELFMRPVFTALKKNQVIMTTGDGSGNEQKFGRQHRCTFLGHPVELPLGPALLAQKTGAALLPLFIIPAKETPYKVIIENEIVPELTGQEAILETSRIFAVRLEQYIRSNPGYMHFLDRFSPKMLIESDE